MTKDRFNEVLSIGDLVAFLREGLLYIGKVKSIDKHILEVVDESNQQNIYKVKGRNAVKFSGNWKEE